METDALVKICVALENQLLCLGGDTPEAGLQFHVVELECDIRASNISARLSDLGYSTSD
jgi:hypothetical protein